MLNGRECLSAAAHLTFANHVHDLDSTKNDAGTAKSLKPHHGPRSTFDRAVILFDNVVEILFLANLDRCFPLGIDRFQSGEVRSALVYRHVLRFAVLRDCPLEICLRGSLVPAGS